MLLRFFRQPIYALPTLLRCIPSGGNSFIDFFIPWTHQCQEIMGSVLDLLLNVLFLYVFEINSQLLPKSMDQLFCKRICQDFVVFAFWLFLFSLDTTWWWDIESFMVYLFCFLGVCLLLSCFVGFKFFVGFECLIFIEAILDLLRPIHQPKCRIIFNLITIPGLLIIIRSWDISGFLDFSYLFKCICAFSFIKIKYFSWKFDKSDCQQPNWEFLISGYEGFIIGDYFLVD